MDERKKAFIKLAEIRVNNALKAMKLLGNLSNKSNYSYDESQVRKILLALDTELKSLKVKFQESNKKRFKL